MKMKFRRLTLNDVRSEFGGQTVRERLTSYAKTMLENGPSDGRGMTYKEVFKRSDLRRVFQEAEKKYPPEEHEKVVVELTEEQYADLKAILEDTTWSNSRVGVEGFCRAVLDAEEFEVDSSEKPVNPDDIQTVNADQ